MPFNVGWAQGSVIVRVEHASSARWEGVTAMGRGAQGDPKLEHNNDHICGGKDSSPSAKGCQHYPGDTRRRMGRTQSEAQWCTEQSSNMRVVPYSSRPRAFNCRCRSEVLTFHATVLAWPSSGSKSRWGCFLLYSVDRYRRMSLAVAVAASVSLFRWR